MNTHQAINFTLGLPPKKDRCRNSIYFVKDDGIVRFYIIDSKGEAYLLYSSDEDLNLTSDGTIDIVKDEFGNLTIKISQNIIDQINSIDSYKEWTIVVGNKEYKVGDEDFVEFEGDNIDIDLEDSKVIISLPESILQGIEDGKEAFILVNDHIGDKNNPHEVDKEQIGLSNVDNTSDKDKPVSDATQEALDEKQEKLTPGNNIQIDQDVISATDTTYPLLSETDVSNVYSSKEGLLTGSRLWYFLRDKIDNESIVVDSQKIVVKGTNWSAEQFYKNKKIEHQNSTEES